MSIRKSLATKAVAVMLSATALVGIGALTSPASASSQGFRIHNNSRVALRLDELTGSEGFDFEARPDMDSVLAPGQTAVFEVKWVSFYDHVWIRYASPDGEYVIANVEVKWALTPVSNCYTVANSMNCEASKWSPKEITITDR